MGNYIVNYGSFVFAYSPDSGTSHYRLNPSTIGSRVYEKTDQDRIAEGVKTGLEMEVGGGVVSAILNRSSQLVKLIERPAQQTVSSSLFGNTVASLESSTLVVAKYGPLNPGPLTIDLANTFRSGTYAEVITQKPTVLYRVYGGSAGELGAYWTATQPVGPVQSIIDSALHPQWGNTAINIVKIEVPRGVTYFQGAAASQGGLVGGGNQVLFPLGFKIDPSWIKRL